MAFTRITRTIESPGVEILETDISQRVSPPAGTKIYTMGYADQGPTDEVLQITSVSDFESVYGTPKNAAERYFYHTVRGALNSPATVYCNRLPYGAGSGVGFGSQYTVLAFPASAFTGGAQYNTLVNIPSSVFAASPTLSTTGNILSGTLVTPANYITYTTFNSGLLSAFQSIGGFTSTFDIISGIYFVGKPTQFALSESEYQSLINGSLFEWSATPRSTFTDVNELSSAGLLVINKAQTVTDPQYNGYYIAIGDNVDTDNLSTDFNKVTYAYTVTQSGVNSNFTVIPDTVLTFPLSSGVDSNANSISRILETQTTSYIINSQEFSDHLLVNTYKLRKVFGNDDPRKLTFVVDSKYAGSIDSYRTVSTQNSVDEQAFLETESRNTNYQILVNPFISNQNGSFGGRSSLSNLNALKKVRVLTRTLSGKLSSEVGFSSLGTGTLSTVGGIIEGAVANIGYCDGLFPLGAYSDQRLTSKVVGNVAAKVDKGLEKVRNKDIFDLDIFVEGGLGTINAYDTVVNGINSGLFVDTNYPETLRTKVAEIQKSSPDGTELINAYDGVLTKYSSFCSSMQEGGRGDSFFIADPLRWIFVEGKNLKTIQKSGAAFSTSIYYPLRHLYEQYNTNYGAVYANWLKVNDSFVNEDVWVPASGFIAGKYAVTDAIVGPWGAPAGFNRGILNNVVDIAFSPNQKQRDDLYKASFNPIVQFPGQGIAIFGQKTLQKKPSAFDRINVRRLFLYSEKAIYKTMQYFVFENNTDFTRRRVVNTLNPFFERIKAAEGVYDFKVICNSDNNTAEVIDNNELVVTILIKAVRTGEFILVNFVATRTDTNFEELVG